MYNFQFNLPRGKHVIPDDYDVEADKEDPSQARLAVEYQDGDEDENDEGGDDGDEEYDDEGEKDNNGNYRDENGDANGDDDEGEESDHFKDWLANGGKDRNRIAHLESVRTTTEMNSAFCLVI